MRTRCFPRQGRQPFPEAASAASGDMIFMKAELECRGRTELFGRVDTREAIRDSLQAILEDSVLDTLQRAYTVKINEYTVNLRSSEEVLALLNACLDQYDAEDQYSAELKVDPGRELNVLTASVRRTENWKRRRAPGEQDWKRFSRRPWRRRSLPVRRALRSWITDWWAWNLTIPWRWWRPISWRTSLRRFRRRWSR